MNQVSEGIWDRAKAQVAGVSGAVKGIGDRAVGAAVRGYGGLTKNTAVQQAGQALSNKGKASGQIAKIENYRNTAKQKIQKLSNEIFSDLQKLGINLQGLGANVANGFIGNLNKGFDQLITDINSSYSQAPTPSTSAASTSSPTPAAPTPSVIAPSASTPVAPGASAPTPSSKTSGGKFIAKNEKAALDTLQKDKFNLEHDPNSLIGIAKFVAGAAGVGTKRGAPKDGVELLSNKTVLNDPSKVKPEDKAKIDAALKQLSGKLGVDQNRLVKLLGQVFTESKSFKDFFRTH